MAKSNNENLEVELLRAKLENLEGKVNKPQTEEEKFLEREAKYNAKAEERAKLQEQIDKRRLELMMDPQFLGKMTPSDAILLEAWERRKAQVEKSNPNFAIHLGNAIVRKKRDILQRMV